MKKILLATVAAIGLIGAAPMAFVNTNSGSTFWVCATAQEADLDRTAFEALTWVQVGGVGSVGEAGSSVNILTYDTWDKLVVQKAKGLIDAGSPELEVPRLPYDAGQIILRTAAATANANYATKIIRTDPVYSGGQPTIIYNRGIVTGPKRPLGRNEDFDLEVFTFGFNQKEVVVDPTTSGTAPTNTAAPAITGTATTGQTLTLSNGTWTGSPTPTYSYSWYAGGVQIPGAVNNTFMLTAAQTGKIIQGRVVATSTAGIGQAFSAATSAVA